MSFRPTLEDCRNVVNQQIELLKQTAEDGYVKLGRGCLLIEFFEKDKGDWHMACLYQTKDQLPSWCKDADFVTELGAIVDSYEPDTECPFVLLLDVEVLAHGLIDFFAGTR